ncbi:HEAT repeat domain-containing protein [Limnoglobus roseus]|uniref:HEAT repeat domain-containing protein n=1 Tax=Limnoglobus roseus TaxID=2598579 RepID=A0A5C1ASC2_9BACT|nr:HEAT repeat domain-containing protein [Limnoglobus roseus]QEL20134.1 hypothetical protein PX52LOC_07222 [Limnoglobus roseus]
MSIAVLTQVYTEARRLAIAGSVVTRGDFRLKKLLPPLEQAGKQAPIFAKVAEAATKVIDGPEASSAEALLELTSLVNAVLYTQGETGLAGKLEAVETTDLGGSIVQTSARVLKPLLEALSSTGSGRLELVKDAHDRGLFRDLRLVKPALAALDDPYPEIAELIAEKVLPVYGKAILPELRAKYDLKGTKGHPRRLTLMHAIDPAGAKELVKAALDGGSKEVKVAAIACLGADDLSFLLEQAAAKAQDVRAAAYRALAGIDKPDAVAVLAKAVAGKDYEIAAAAIEHGTNPKLVAVLATEIRSAVDSVPKLKDKKQISTAVERIVHLFCCFPKGEHPAADALILDVFARRGELAKTKGATFSGSDIGETVVQVMADGSKAIRQALVAAHADLTADELEHAFTAGRGCLTSAKLFDTFSPYMTAKVDEKKKAKDPAWAKREAVIDGIECDPHHRNRDDEDDDDNGPYHPKTPYDPRWLDLAVGIKRLDLVQSLAQPGHAAAQAFAKAEFDAALKKAKTPIDVQQHVTTLIDLRHPNAVEAFFAGLGKRGKKTPYYHYYWFANSIPQLPKEAITRLEEFAATLPEHESNHWLEMIHKLRTKSE